MDKIKQTNRTFRHSPTLRIMLTALLLAFLISIPFMGVVMWGKIAADTASERIQTEKIVDDIKYILINTANPSQEDEITKVFAHYAVFAGDNYEIRNQNREPYLVQYSNIPSYIKSPWIEKAANLVAHFQSDHYLKDWASPARVYEKSENGHYIYETKHRVIHHNHSDEIIIRRDLTELYAKTVRNGLQHGAMTLILLYVVIFLLYIFFSRKNIALIKKVVDEQQTIIAQGDWKTNIGKRHNKELGEISDIIIKLHKEANEAYRFNKNILQEISHETASRLTEIKQSIDLIRYYGTEDKERVITLLEKADKAVASISDTQAAFTDLARVDNLKTLAPADSYPVKELINYAIKQAQNEHPDYEFVQDEPGSDKCLYIRREHFFIIMRILLNNAVKYSENSHLVVVSILDGVYKDKVAIKVTNWGIHIPDDEKTRIFERYYRGRNTRNISGTGLGLHIISKTMKLYNGEVFVESEYTGETSFFVVFPKEIVLENNQ